MFDNNLLIRIIIAFLLVGVLKAELSPQPVTEELNSTTVPTTTPPTRPPATATTKYPKNVLKKYVVSVWDSLICPPECQCSASKISCEGKKQKFPPNLNNPMYANISMISLRNGQLDQFDFNWLPLGAIEHLDLSNNSIKTIVPFVKKSKAPNKLKTLNLSSNMLEDLANFSSWSMASLELLDLSNNPLKELTPSSLNNTKNVQILRLDQTKLRYIHEQAFNPIGQLRTLNMSGVKLTIHLGDKQFVQNQKLDTIDLTDNGLVEVPFALRSTSSISKLILNSNGLTSLRQSDFINRTQLAELEVQNCTKLTKVDEFAFSDLYKLTTLTLSNNPKLRHISPDAFFRSSDKKFETLEVIDLRNNDIITMQEPAFDGYFQLLLSGNPWNCDCQMKWLQALPKERRPSVHCKTPELYKDMEISQFFNTMDCDLVESDRTVLITGILLFSLGLLVAFVVQRNEFCRRILWRERPYSTIYYTKASFPPDTV